MKSQIVYNPDTLDRPLNESVSGVIEVCVLALYEDEDTPCVQTFESQEISFVLKDPCQYSSLIANEEEIVLKVQ